MSAKIGRAGRARLLVCAVGLTMLVLGLAGVARVLFLSAPNDLQFLDISLTASLMGAMLLGQGILAKYRVAVEEAYNFGHDIGVEEGFQQGRKVGKPVVVDLTYPKDEVQIRRHPE